MRKTTLFGLASVLVLVAAVLAQQTPAATGKVKLSVENAALDLKAADKTQTAVSGSAEASLAPGVYTPAKLVLSKRQVKEDAGKKQESQWTLSSRGPWGGLGKITVTAGETTVVKLGEPLTIKTDPTEGEDGAMTIGLRVVGTGGEVYAPYAAKDGKPVAVPPKITIVDEAAKVLATGSFQFG